MNEPSLYAWMTLRAAQLPEALPKERQASFHALWAELEALGADAWPQLPRAVAAHLAPFGWHWNGLYRLEEDGSLLLGAAAGPPVCNHLVAGAPGEAGMCHDALHWQQTLVCADPKAWPGYVSCDGPSGLVTRGGIVVPIPGAGGESPGVWDLDAVEALHPADAPLMDALVRSLARRHPPTYASLGAG